MHLSFISVEFSMGIIKYDLYVNNFIFSFYQFGTLSLQLLKFQVKFLILQRGTDMSIFQELLSYSQKTKWIVSL